MYLNLSFVLVHGSASTTMGDLSGKSTSFLGKYIRAYQTSQPTLNQVACSTVETSTIALKTTLQAFVKQTPGIQGTVLASIDGLPLASHLTDSIDAEQAAAVSASMLSLGERIGKELVRGTIGCLFVEGNQGYALLTGCGDNAVLLVLAASSVKQGILLLELKRIVTDVKNSLG